MTRISVFAVNGTVMTSQAFLGNSLVYRSQWSGSWRATIVNPQPAGFAVPPAPYQPGFQFTAFCTDIGNVMGNGTYNYTAAAFSSADLNSPEGTSPDPNWANSFSGGRAAWLYNTFVSKVDATGNLPINNLVTTQADRRAAMAIGIWELLYENIGSVGTGYDVASRQNFGVNSRSFVAAGSQTVLDLANYWIDQGESAHFAPPYDYTWFQEQQTPDVQSIIGPTPVVPEPGTILAGALLLLPFGASALRRMRRA